jgi:prepilin-type N-terminal cleavage/methylation domain-containing protein
MGNVEYKVKSPEFACLHEAFRRRQEVRSIKTKCCEHKINCELFSRHSAFGNPQSGMTLIEVIMVMVIIGILAATIIPRFDFTTSSRASVDGAAYMIASDIRYTQESSMANRISKSITFSTSNPPGPTGYSFTPISSFDPSGQLPSGVTISNNFSITFNSLGEPITTTPPGIWSVTISAGGQSRTITVVNYTGKVNIS